MMTPDRLTEILRELSTETEYGIAAVACSDSSEKSFYIWWGESSRALAATSRLAHALNTELDDDPDEIADTHRGNYL